MNNKDDLERLLGQQLNRRVAGMDDAPLGLGDVKGRAGRIQRNRRLAAGAGLAAAVAIIVPAAMFAGNGLDRADRDLPPATNSPSESPTGPTSPQPTVNEKGVPEVDLGKGAPDGAAPAVAYLDGSTLVRPDGTEVELTEAYQGFAIVGDQLLGVRSDDQGNRALDVMTTDGEVTETIEIVEGIATNPDGTTVAWSTPEGGITTMWADGRVDLSGQGEPVSVAAVTGGPDCHEDADGCMVFFNPQGVSPTPMFTDSHGITDVAAPGAIKVNDAFDQRAAVQRSYSDTGSCSGMFDRSSNDYVWKTCDYALQSFSPDGSLLLATDAYGDGIGHGYVVVLNAETGDPLVQYSIEGGFIGDLAWDDAGHALLTAYGPQGWNVYRVDASGGVVRALGPDGAPDVDRPFTMAVTP